MRRSRPRRAIVAVAILVLIALAAVGLDNLLCRDRWPSPVASTVALADYRAANPTGVPAELASADVVKRGEYLARAADCVVCHTAPGGKPLRRRLGVPLPFGTLYSTNITPDKETGIGDYSDAGFPERGAAWHPPGRRAPLSGDAVHAPTPT